VASLESVDEDTAAELESLTRQLADSNAQLKERLGVQEKLLSGLQTGFLQLSENYQAADAQLSRDIAEVASDADSRFAEMESKLQAQADLIADLRSDIDALERNIADINAQFNQVISDQDELTIGRMAALMSQLNDLRTRVEELEAAGAPKPKTGDSGASSLLLIGGLAAAAALLLGGAK